MEKVLTTNNGESNWDKLKTFGLHSRGSHIGFNRYSGRNGAVLKVDPATGMRVMLVPASIPRTERPIKVPGKRGRPAIVGCVQQFEGKKRGRPAQFGPIMFRAPMKRGRKPYTPEQKAAAEAIKAELAGLVFYNHPQKKRGPKAGTVQTASEGSEPGKRRGRLSNAEKIKLAKPGEIVKEKGGYWLKMACGLATWVGQG